MDHLSWILEELFSYGGWPGFLIICYGAVRVYFSDIEARLTSMPVAIGSIILLAGIAGYWTYDMHIKKPARYETYTHTEDDDNYGGNRVSEQEWVGPQHGSKDAIEKGIAVGLITFVPLILGFLHGRKEGKEKLDAFMSSQSVAAP